MVSIQPLIDPNKLVKPWYVTALKYWCMFHHMFTVCFYTVSIICQACGIMVTLTDPIMLKTGYPFLDVIAVKLNPLMTEEKWFIAVILFIGCLLTTYDMTSVWTDDFYIVSRGRFPEQMIFMFLIQMFAGMFLFTPKYLQKHFLRTGIYVLVWAVPRLLFTAQMGALVRDELRKAA
ncbi:hypothetical protein HDE_07883 [Halotydeus destructor]|nr:hypothetical protein HDE_07883 [Halotydeus destructor]